MARNNGPRTRIVMDALFVLALLAFLSPSAAAQTRSDTWLVDVGVEADVCDGYALVEVTAHIRNRGPDPEFPFVVQVPDGAFVTNLTITRDGQTHYGHVAGREEARAAYEEHKSAEMTGGLVEKQRGSQAFSYLINVAEFEEVYATLRYEQYLSAVRGVDDLHLEAPVSGFGQDMGAGFVVRLCAGESLAAWTDQGTTPWTAGDGTVWFSHSFGPRTSDDATPFDVHFTRDATFASGDLAAAVMDGQGYFAHRFRADPDPDRLPADIVLALDISGSMNGEKVTQLQDAARQLVASLGQEDRLHLAFFSSTVQSPWSGMRSMTPEDRQEAIEAIDAVFAGGGTNIEAALQRSYDALADSDPERAPLVMLLSDGQATVGPATHTLVSDRAAEGVRLFTIAFGADADWSLLYTLAQEGEGVAEHVETGSGAEVDLQRFMQAWTTPVLRDLKITYGAGAEALVEDVDILFSGSELLVVGTFDPEMTEITGHVEATAADGPVQGDFTISVQAADAHPFLSRLAAYKQVRALEDRVDAGDATAEAELLELALKHSFVTDLTSLVLLLPGSGIPEAQTDTPSAWSSGTAMTTSTSTTTATGTWTTVADRSTSTSTMTWTDTGVADEEGESTQIPGPGILGAAAALAVAALVRRRR